MYFNHTDALKDILCPMRPGIQFHRALPETQSNLYHTGRPTIGIGATLEQWSLKPATTITPSFFRNKVLGSRVRHLFPIQRSANEARQESKRLPKLTAPCIQRLFALKVPPVPAQSRPSEKAQLKHSGSGGPANPPASTADVYSIHFEP